MVHGVKPLFSFDLAEATFLVPIPDADPTSRSDLISWHARQLQKCVEDIDNIWERFLISWFASIKQFEAQFKNWIQDHNFQPGNLVLVWNTQVEKELNRKMKPRYLSPMVVLQRTTGGSYLLAELDGSILRLRYAAFRLLPYFPRNEIAILVTELTGLVNQKLDDHEAEEDVEHKEDREEAVLDD